MRVITGILAVVALTLSGCSEAAEPVVLPSSPDASGPSPTQPTPSAETTPPSAAPRDDDALRFLESYLFTANEALTEPSALEVWRSSFADSCSVCLAGYEAASSIHDQGQSVDGGALVDWTTTRQSATSRQVEVLVVGAIDAAAVTSADGEVVARYDSVDAATVLYTLRKQPDDSWLVVAGELVG